MNNDADTEQLIAAELASFTPSAEKMPGVVSIHDIRSQTLIWMSKKGMEQMGVNPKDIIGKPTAAMYSNGFTDAEPSDFIPKVVALLQRNDDSLVTFMEHLKLIGQEDYSWHMSSLKILARDLNGLPLLVVNISIPIDSMNPMTAKADRMLEENDFLKKNLALFALLSKREKEVLRHWAMGRSAVESSKLFHLSVLTVETHRKNVKKKLKVSSFFEVQQYARSFDLI